MIAIEVYRCDKEQIVRSGCESAFALLRALLIGAEALGWASALSIAHLTTTKCPLLYRYERPLPL